MSNQFLKKSEKPHKSNNRVNDLKDLKKLYGVPYTICSVDIPREYIGCREIVSNASDKCFLNPFSENDVKYFLKELEIPLFRSQKQYLEKESRLKQILSGWVTQKKRIGKNLNPLEPFLYALKLCDGIIGSAATVAEPNFEVLDIFAKVLLRYWDVSFEEDTKIISHILVNWSWYQPLLVVIRMYQLQEGYDNNEIDTILRNYKLFTPDYATVTFECLTHHNSKENIEILLKFVLKVCQSAAITSSEIQVTNRMRDLFRTMYYCLDRDKKDWLKNLYIEKYRAYADKKSRSFLDKTMNIESNNPILDNFYKYQIALSDEEREKYYNYLVRYWDISDNKNQIIFKILSDDKMLELAVRKLRNTNSYIYGKSLFYLAQNKYLKAQKFVKKEFEMASIGDSTWFACACASNYLYKKPDMKEIAEVFFLSDAGYKYRNILQTLTRSPEKAKEFRDTARSIADDIMEECDKWGIFLNGCQHLYSGEYGRTNYPVEIDRMLEKAIEHAAESDIHLIYDVLNVIENIICRSNRDRYRDMLHKIFYQRIFTESANNRAREILNKVYLG